MGRGRDPHDTERDDFSIDPEERGHAPRRQRTHRTPAPGLDPDVEDLRDEVDRIREVLRPLEELAIMLRGAAGQPGALDDIRGKVTAVRMELAAAETRLEVKVDKVAARISEFERVVDGMKQIHWKILVAASTAGAIIAAVLTLASKYL